MNQLNQNGIQLVGNRLEAKHLAAIPKRPTSTAKNRKPRK
jgi:hypothetical protein